jgi:alpha-D-ribose 1-methylphosphonate 5-triphosphate synthase subunit PhnH
MEPQVRKVMPPHPGASITVEQAMAAFAAVEEEQRQERLRRNAARRMKYRDSKRAEAREP